MERGLLPTNTVAAVYSLTVSREMGTVTAKLKIVYVKGLDNNIHSWLHEDYDNSLYCNLTFTQRTHVYIFYSPISRKGDYHRYLAEFALGNNRKEAAENSLVAYKTATDLAMSELPPTHPIRLGLALNFSVFYYEILNSPDRACRLLSLQCNVWSVKFH